MSSTTQKNARQHRQALGEETVAILERGSYQSEDGTEVRIGPQIKTCVEGTQLYLEDELELLLQSARRRIDAIPQDARSAPLLCARLLTTTESTLDACKRYRFSQATQNARIGALNFASAKNPGGGFLNGSQAQEESIARSSALYASLVTCKAEYYDYNRRQNTLLYSDRMIYSPECTIFREEDSSLLATPYEVDVLTSPAPNKGAIKQNKRSEIKQVPDTFERRIRLMLSLFAQRGCNVLVLGAWGCGVFGNEPGDVAALFEKILVEEGFAALFDEVCFAIYEPSKKRPAGEHGPCTSAFAQHFTLHA